MTRPISPDTTLRMPKPRGEQAQAMRNANSNFEEIILRQVVKAMRKTVPDSGLMGSKSGKQLFDHLIENALSATLANKGGIGIARIMEEGQQGGPKKKSHVSFKVYSQDHDIGDRGRPRP